MSQRSLNIQRDEANLDSVKFPYEDQQRWSLIESLLKPIIEDASNNTKDRIIKTIFKLCTSYPIDYKDENFVVLSHALDLFEEQYYPDDYHTGDSYIRTVIPFVAQLVMRTQELWPKGTLAYLKIGQNKSVEMTRMQVACILANSFFCTFTRSSAEETFEVYPSINLDEMYCQVPNYQPKLGKMLMFLNYFARIFTEREKYSSPDLKITIFRHSVQVPQQLSDFENSTKPLTSVEVHSNGSISDSKDAIQADFANKFIGGGSISYGCVQEEIEFSLCPEMNASRLICQVMADNESILISGAEQFSKHTGYAFTLGYGGNYIDNNKDEIGNSKKQTCAIDACIFFNYKVPSQWKKTYIDREMIKAYAGFSSSPLTKVATGNWGCGAFNGDKKLKSIIQILSASQAEKHVIYYTFKTQELDEELAEFIERLKQNNITVGKLYKALLDVGTVSDTMPIDTFDTLKQILSV